MSQKSRPGVSCPVPRTKILHTAVVLGAPSSAARALKAAQLLERGFSSRHALSWLMPPLGTVVRDDDAVAAVQAWIVSQYARRAATSQ